MFPSWSATSFDLPKWPVSTACNHAAPNGTCSSSLNAALGNCRSINVIHRVVDVRLRIASDDFQIRRRHGAGVPLDVLLPGGQSDARTTRPCRWKKLIHSIIEARRAAKRTGAAATSSTCYPRHTGRMERTCSLMKYRQWSSQSTRQRPRHCSGCARCLPIHRNGKLTPQKHQGSSSRLKGPRQAFRSSVYPGSGTRDSSALSSSVCDRATGHAI
jgi:hypothetical protein